MAQQKIIGILLCLVVAINALPAQDQTRSARNNNLLTEDDLLDNLQADCLRKDSTACVKYKIFNFVDKTLGHKDIITVTDGVNIVKTGNSAFDGAPRALASNTTMETLIINRLQRFLDTHSIKIDLKGSDVINSITSTARSMSEYASSLLEEEDDDDEDNLTEESRGKKKKKKKIIKMLGPILGLAALKAALLGKLAMAGVALIAGKALIMAKIALLISVIIGAKKLLSSGGWAGGGGSQVYDVVAQPHHTSSHETHGGGDYGGGYGSSGHGGWGRSAEAQQLAYRGHTQSTKQ